MQTTGRDSVLILELPDKRFRDANAFQVRGYLTDDAGKNRVSFDSVSTVQFGEVTCLQLSSSVLDEGRRVHRFSKAYLRSERPINIGLIIWISYVPAATKDGVAFPSALTRSQDAAYRP
jgi:hypothetical protein